MKITDKHTGNVFIMPQIEAKYLNRAKKSELKILYYLFAHGRSADLAEICRALEETPDSVSSALAFWRGVGVIELSDEEETPEAPQPLPTAENQPASSVSAPKEPAPTETQPEPAAQVPSPSPSPSPTSGYTLSEIASARDRNAEFASLVSYLEKLAGRLYNEAEQGIVLFLYDTLGIKCEVIMGVAQYCVSKGKSSIRYIQKTVMNLTDEGIHTYEELEAYLLDRKQKDDYRGMVKRVIGASRAFTKPECGHIDRWEKRGISEDLVALSYEKTISKIGKPQIAYMAKILDGWLEKDLKTPEEVEAYFKNPENRLLNGTNGNSSKSERLDFDLDDIFERP